MSEHSETLPLQETIKQLYEIIERLDISYKKHGRKFTLDGHLLGSIGEVWAAEYYGIDLYPNGTELYDGSSEHLFNGRKAAKNGQISISLDVLKKQAESVAEACKISVLPTVR